MQVSGALSVYDWTGLPIQKAPHLFPKPSFLRRAHRKVKTGNQIVLAVSDATMSGVTNLIEEISNCTLCRDRFAATETAHEPRPVAWFNAKARILIAGQAPGMKVHLSGKPFTDPSGDRLRDWMGVDTDVFYDRTQVAIVPMAFCFPGYSVSGSDLPPPAICAQTWRAKVLDGLPNVKLTLIIGAYAMKYHLGRKMPVGDAVKAWKTHGDGIFVLPHPSWRNTGWLKKNAWFEEEVLPRLRERIWDVLND